MLTIEVLTFLNEDSSLIFNRGHLYLCKINMVQWEQETFLPEIDKNIS